MKATVGPDLKDREEKRTKRITFEGTMQQYTELIVRRRHFEYR